MSLSMSKGLIYILTSLFQSYVSCALGVQMVGYVMICCSLSSTVFSPLIGHLTAYAGARSLILAAVVANAVLLIYMLLWQPDEDSLGMILAVSGGWAVVRTVWRIQLFGRHLLSSYSFLTRRP